MLKTQLKGILLLCLVGCLLACKNTKGQKKEEAQKQEQPQYKTWREMKVTATAYNSVVSQTKKGNPAIAAWGDTLRPGMKAIAVSRDLIKKGLEHNTRVKIKGLNGFYYVKDKMNRRWTMKIDIYMGTNVQKALNWGRKEVMIYVETEK